MAERILTRYRRVGFSKPLTSALAPVQKPVVAQNGAKQNRLCAICLGRLQPGNAMTFCDCGRFFHLGCIYGIGACPVCGHGFTQSPEESEGSPAQSNSQEYIENTQTVYQCPECGALVREDSVSCICGAVFDSDKEEYICPSCGQNVAENDEKCAHCGTDFESQAEPKC